MNRRSIIRGLVASAALPALPMSPAAAKDADTVKRETLRGLLAMSDEDAFSFYLLRVAMTEDHRCCAYAFELFESGVVPVDEVQQRVTARVHYNLYGPQGAPVYDGTECRSAAVAWIGGSPNPGVQHETVQARRRD